MPVTGDPQPITILPAQINLVPEQPGFFISLQLQTDGTVSQQIQDEVQQSLIDWLQEWPGRSTVADVTGNRYQTLLYSVGPTNPIYVPPPPEGLAS